MAGSLIQQLRAECHLLSVLACNDDQNFEIVLKFSNRRWTVRTHDRYHMHAAPMLEGKGATFAEAWIAQRSIENDREASINDVQFRG